MNNNNVETIQFWEEFGVWEILESLQEQNKYIGKEEQTIIEEGEIKMVLTSIQIRNELRWAESASKEQRRKKSCYWVHFDKKMPTIKKEGIKKQKKKKKKDTSPIKWKRKKILFIKNNHEKEKEKKKVPPKAFI